MSGARIRRGGSTRMSVRSKGRAAGRQGASVRKTSGLNALIARIPLSHATLQRGITWSIILAVIFAIVGAARFFGLPDMAHMELAELAARTGYEVDKVEVHGVKRMDEKAVYAIALGQVDRSMMNVDLGKLRMQIMQLPWVKDARVSRRLPNTLVVDIVERQPTAIWQHEGKLALIDETGAVLESVSAKSLPDLPLLVGDAANLQAERLARLMEAAPALKPVLSGATWVGNRRWDLRFQSGETLALPEGDAQAAAALVNFARLDGINRLLGRGIIRFDMRDPNKFVLRMPKDRAAPNIVGSAAPPVDEEVQPEATGVTQGQMPESKGQA